MVELNLNSSLHLSCIRYIPKLDVYRLYMSDIEICLVSVDGELDVEIDLSHESSRTIRALSLGTGSFAKCVRAIPREILSNAIVTDSFGGTTSKVQLSPSTMKSRVDYAQYELQPGHRYCISTSNSEYCISPVLGHLFESYSTLTQHSVLMPSGLLGCIVSLGVFIWSVSYLLNSGIGRTEQVFHAMNAFLALHYARACWPMRMMTTARRDQRKLIVDRVWTLQLFTSLLSTWMFTLAMSRNLYSSSSLCLAVVLVYDVVTMMIHIKQEIPAYPVFWMCVLCVIVLGLVYSAATFSIPHWIISLQQLTVR